MGKGRLAVNPAREVRRASTKEGRSRRLTADPVLLPSWQELALLASHPPRREDRLLILTIAWAGLRWSEAVGLAVSDVWPERPKLSVRRFFVWNDDIGGWQVEQVKGGNAATVPSRLPCGRPYSSSPSPASSRTDPAGTCCSAPPSTAVA